MATYNGSNFRWMTNARHIQLCDESSRWENNNPIILPGEIAVVSNKRKLKLGTGEHYNDTKYYAIGTEPVNIENLDNIVMDKTNLHFFPAIGDDDLVTVDYLTIEDKLILPRTSAHAVLLSENTIAMNTRFPDPIHTLQDWINKVDKYSMIIFKNITIAHTSFDENRRFVYENDIIEDTMVPNVYFSKDTLQYARDADMRTYTEEGKLVIEYNNDPPENDVLIETAILIPT